MIVRPENPADVAAIDETPGAGEVVYPSAFAHLE